jgi:hypothetical protein
MMIQVREYALLTSDNTQPASMDLGIVSEATFSWLEQLQQSGVVPLKFSAGNFCVWEAMSVICNPRLASQLKFCQNHS